jgi:hypothetical protein
MVFRNAHTLVSKQNGDALNRDASLEQSHGKRIAETMGKRALIEVIRGARPFELPVAGVYFDVWLVEEAHRLPGRLKRWWLC